MKSKSKPKFYPNLAYGDAKYTISVHRDYWYNGRMRTDNSGAYIGKPERRDDGQKYYPFIVSEGGKPCIKRFKRKSDATKWLKSNLLHITGGDPNTRCGVTKLWTKKQVDDFMKCSRKMGMIFE